MFPEEFERLAIKNAGQVSFVKVSEIDWIRGGGGLLRLPYTSEREPNCCAVAWRNSSRMDQAGCFAAFTVRPS